MAMYSIELPGRPCTLLSIAICPQHNSRLFAEKINLIGLFRAQSYMCIFAEEAVPCFAE